MVEVGGLMAKKQQKMNQSSKRALRNLRIQQIVFVMIGVIVILSMVLALIAD
jgi:hypothetical protein